MELKAVPLNHQPENAMLIGITYVGGGIYKTKEAQRIAACVNFFRKIPNSDLYEVMKELRAYYSGVEDAV